MKQVEPYRPKQAYKSITHSDQLPVYAEHSAVKPSSTRSVQRCQRQEKRKSKTKIPLDSEGRRPRGAASPSSRAKTQAFYGFHVQVQCSYLNGPLLHVCISEIITHHMEQDCSCKKLASEPDSILQTLHARLHRSVASNI